MSVKYLNTCFGVLLSMGLLAPNLASAADAQTFQKQLQNVKEFSAARGKDFWVAKHNSKGKDRSCVSCHGDNLKTNGKHAKTGKSIDPMAPSVNAERYTDMKKIEKWFKRNCKWVLGHECSAQEKGDVLEYLRNL